MTTKIINAKIVLRDGVSDSHTLIIKDGLIASLTDDGSACDKVIDAEGGYLLAGFIDIHCHGGNGYDFMDATPEQMRKISEFHLSHGTTTLVATTVTDTWENIESALARFGELGDDRARAVCSESACSFTFSSWPWASCCCKAWSSWVLCTRTLWVSSSRP